MIETLRTGAAKAYRDFAIDGAALFAQRWGRGHGLKPEGKPHFEKFVLKVKSGEKADPAKSIRMLDGFNHTAEGRDLLKNQGSILLLSNHSVEGPLRGYGNTVLIDYIYNEESGGRIRWIQGQGSSPVNLIHEALGNTMNTITVGGGNGISGAKELLRAFKNGESVGLYPEGIQRARLQKGDLRAGKVIILSAILDIPIFCASSYFSNGFFRLYIDRLDNSKIMKIKDLPQDVVDFAMTTIAQHLPWNRRGYYQKKA